MNKIYVYLKGNGFGKFEVLSQHCPVETERKNEALIQDI
jgi:hypothetical protein